MHTVTINSIVLHGVKHLDAAADQLHQVFVRADDSAASTCLTRLNCQCGDDVIGLIAFLLLARDVEGMRCFAGQWHLRAQVLWHGLSVGLVEVVHVVAKRVAALIENHRNMGHIPPGSLRHSVATCCKSQKPLRWAARQICALEGAARGRRER